MITRDRLRGGAAELVVVIIGVLIALSADRWVQALDDRDRERTQLGWIASDLEADSAMLAYAIEASEQRIAYVRTLLDAADRPGPVPPDEIQDFIRAFIRVGWSTSPTFASATWSEMVASGDLSLIRDTELRRDLSGYYHYQDAFLQVEANRDRLGRELEDRTIALYPYLSLDADALGDREPIPEDVSPAQVARLLDRTRDPDSEMRGLISYAGTASAVRIWLYRDFMDRVSELLVRVRRAAS